MRYFGAGRGFNAPARHLLRPDVRLGHRRPRTKRGWRGFDGIGLFIDTTEGGAEALFVVVVTELVLR
jgi:hypothetical protein